jgi:hypothetical protein
MNQLLTGAPCTRHFFTPQSPQGTKKLEPLFWKVFQAFLCAWGWRYHGEKTMEKHGKTIFNRKIRRLSGSFDTGVPLPGWLSKSSWVASREM